MIDSKHFCPILKTSEILFDKWTILIVRECFLGTIRFSDFQRNIALISPTILTKRLKSLVHNGILFRDRQPLTSTYEYRLTTAGLALKPIVDSLESWSLSWANKDMTEEEQNVMVLMTHIQESIRTEKLPNTEIVIQFTFSDLAKYKDWWIWVSINSIRLCTEDIQKDVDLYIFSETKHIKQIISKEISINSAIRTNFIKMHGSNRLINSFSKWIGIST